MHRQLRLARRRAVTLLELLVVLVLLGLSAALVLPSLRLPDAARSLSSPLQRARAIAVRRGEAVRLEYAADGHWTVRATADTAQAVLLAGDGGLDDAASAAPSARGMLISAIGACFPDAADGSQPGGWDPARCAQAQR